jgi:hypothetical protein
VNRRLAKAIVASFQEFSEDTHYAHLSAFDRRAWIGTYRWLDASGLALYFLARIRHLNIEGAIPMEVLQRLEENAADNRIRSATMFEEFVRINKAFQGAALSYVNLKGFTLVPDACPHADLRCQFDLDFAVAHKDLVRCEEVLKQEGYWLAGFGNHVREFKAGGGRLPAVRDLYKANPQRALEIHSTNSITHHGANSHEDEVLLTQSCVWNGAKFPVLSKCDKFIGLAFHLFKHLRSEWTRVSWILEYTSYIRFNREDEALWVEVDERVMKNPELKVAVGAATFIANQTFGISYLPSVLVRVSEDLQVPVRLWIKRYGPEVVLAQFPGTKLYLLLQGILDQNKIHGATAGGKLLPLHLPSRVVHPLPEERWLQRFERGITEFRYGCFRLWFHVGKGFVYMLEALRWKRCIAQQQL